MILEAAGISKNYGGLAVLKDVSLGLERGEVCGLIGPNGAGKSTLFRIVLGLVRCDSGKVYLDSEARKPLGGIIEKPALYGYLSAVENLRVFSRVQGLALSRAGALDLLQQVGLPTYRRDPVRNYSMGMKQRLGLAIALLNDPGCLVLDEPFTGLDPIGIKDLRELVRRLAAERQIGILISSHNLVELGDLCDRLYVLDQGEIRHSGPTREILKRATRKYLLYGSGFLGSAALREAASPISDTSAVLIPGQEPVEHLLAKLTSEPGVALTACIPQLDLALLLEKDPA
ncbi:MAG TPA: ABC transporter ATP-binding protein [Robiginitalea sp.]|nr:ABC transporter ATP-binding protein [Robiginitalea sp.]